MSAAVAQEGRWSVGVTGGTLGVGPQVSFRPNEHLGIRANAGFLTVSRDEEVDEIEYDGDLELSSFGAMLDWYPLGGGFRISIGGRANDNEVDLTGAPSSSVTIGDTTYTPQQIGTLTGTVTTDDFTPALSIGYGGTLAKGLTFGAELGVLWQGEPTIENLRGTGLLANAPQFEADIEREESRIEDELDDYELWPILQLKLSYRF
ncbi:hypothetical protein JM946_15105 [Steroidobacter sp. S1-65]|uniref:Outer membrane protein beta-barrel domain-containing protein n=1 Tax=Steroidobacter gossypii TaxID=2805490 RepID=A0ABS1WYK7_9GAMM|nr:hypothetical protein [Steroidobacter gossypii]MBM0106060.1 hypothetical protein [Steroidobacter gossypii]